MYSQEYQSTDPVRVGEERRILNNNELDVGDIDVHKVKETIVVRTCKLKYSIKERAGWPNRGG